MKKENADYYKQLKQLEEEKCELLGIIQDKDEVIAALKKENKICEEIIIGEQQEINRLEKENVELKMKLLTLENKEQIVTTSVSN